ncbi:MAG: flagellar protein FlgN [Roseiarcus sp.]|jgi:hypothetical protein
MSAAIFRRPHLAAADSGRFQNPVAMILPVVDRLRQTLDEENEDIARRGAVDYRAYNLRKSQGLLELNRLAPALAHNQMGPVLRAALADLHAKLETNRRLLRTQLQAAQAVSNIIARAIRESQSDGTYSAQPWLDDDE